MVILEGPPEPVYVLIMVPPPGAVVEDAASAARRLAARLVELQCMKLSLCDLKPPSGALYLERGWRVMLERRLPPKPEL